jgi:hypothetical protein
MRLKLRMKEKGHLFVHLRDLSEEKRGEEDIFVEEGQTLRGGRQGKRLDTPLRGGRTYLWRGALV